MDKEKTIENNLNLHTLLADELLKNHSIAALMELLEMGREIELAYNNQVISITHLNDKFLLAYKENTQYFDDTWSIVVEGKIEDDYFVNYWKKMTIKVLF